MLCILGFGKPQKVAHPSYCNASFSYYSSYLERDHVYSNIGEITWSHDSQRGILEPWESTLSQCCFCVMPRTHSWSRREHPHIGNESLLPVVAPVAQVSCSGAFYRLYRQRESVCLWSIYVMQRSLWWMLLWGPASASKWMHTHSPSISSFPRAGALFSEWLVMVHLSLHHFWFPSYFLQLSFQFLNVIYKYSYIVPCHVKH